MTLAARTIALLSVAAVAAFAFVTDRRASARSLQAEMDYPPIGQFVEVNGRSVHAYVTGNGPDLVLIHGASGNLRDFTQDFVDRVSDRYRVIAFDRPGMGYTDRTDPDYDPAFTSEAESPEEQAALLQAAALALGAERPIVLGQSFGGSVAMAWALNHPEHVSGLVIVSGATMPWPGTLDPLYRVNGSSFGGAILPPLISAWVPMQYVRDVAASVFAPNPGPENYADKVGAALSLRTETLRANARQVNGLRPYVVAMSTRYPTVSVPTELIHGDADTTVPLDIHSRPLSQLVPDANLVVLSGIGHMPHHSAPDDVVAAIDRAADRAGLR
ncbi:alpha/beta fold hydrolase [Flavimaricola marinus]|uniref:2-hydroxy-6-oxo-6-phenylhexa-2,4-dienoate hydrolase n=1 Tax=Flavimaricola marinus TaxID=1819565 RepID=A0A238LCS1_9RHOB|nr:alpha/beta hydrolase [Flavimaricola marinus]SMY07353.1 2-hydroxy-6-oxo-6-phenylhexa-2,4-dienoate hydrolase [Flavimaricola marinus]